MTYFSAGLCELSHGSELDNVRAKIDICKYKQDEAIRETNDIEKELAAERHKYKRVEEELER